MHRSVINITKVNFADAASWTVCVFRFFHFLYQSTLHCILYKKCNPKGNTDRSTHIIILFTISSKDIKLAMWIIFTSVRALACCVLTRKQIDDEDDVDDPDHKTRFYELEIWLLADWHDTQVECNRSHLRFFCNDCQMIIFFAFYFLWSVHCSAHNSKKIKNSSKYRK